MSDLEAIRGAIDAADQELLALLNRRARLAQEAGDAKRASGDAGDRYRPGREAEVLRRITEDNPGPLPDSDVARILREVMSACLALESPLRVAFLGPEGTFTHQAMQRFFGAAAEGHPAGQLEDVFRSVESGDADYGVVPVANSSQGSIGDVLDRLARTPLQVCGEITLPIHHHLLGAASAPEELAKVTDVHAHPQALAQCRAWLAENLPHAKRHEEASNGAACQRIGDGHVAIAGRVAAELHGLLVLASRIEDEPDNATRFLVVGRRAAERTGDDRTSLVVSIHDRPGALRDILKPFSEEGVTLSHIESRPSRVQAWDYRFFIDLEGHVDDAPVGRVLAALEREAARLRVLGSYPRSPL